MPPKTNFQFNRMAFDSQKDFIRSGRRCSMVNPTDLQINRVDQELREFRSARAARVAGATINVQFIHIMSGNQGKITEQQRVKQIAVLNDAYESHGIKFIYDPNTVEHVDRPDWFAMGHRSASEREAKTALQVDPEHNLNFYTAELQGGLLGWATFPFDFLGDPDMDGVVVLHSSLPDGSSAPFNLGATAVHEVGHWLGLYHTFEPRGTCDAIGDHVNDTVAHRDADFGTPEFGPAYTACNGTSPSPVKNFMNYTDDAWMDHFTEGQAQRMLDQIGMYRPEFSTTTPPPPPPPPPPDVTPLKLVATGKGNLSGDGKEKMFSVQLKSKVTVTLDGPGGVDFDLYVRRDTPPTTNEYDQRAYSPGADETLEVTPPSPALYYIMARSYSGAGNFTLKVEGVD